MDVETFLRRERDLTFLKMLQAQVRGVEKLIQIAARQSLQCGNDWDAEDYFLSICHKYIEFTRQAEHAIERAKKRLAEHQVSLSFLKKVGVEPQR